MNKKYLVLLLIVMSSVSLSPLTAKAEEFIPIGDGLECVRYSNGNEYVVTAHNPDYEIVDSKELVKKLVIERTQLKKRTEKLKEFSKTYLKKTVDNATAKKFKGYFAAFLFGTANISFPDPELLRELEDRRAIVAQIKQTIADRKTAIATYLQRIKDCSEGKVAAPKGGIYIFPEVRLVGFRAVSAPEAYGGFILADQARKNKFSKKPTGFNGCLKLYFKDGTVAGRYTGMGDEVCDGTPGLFQYATSACNATLKKGEVGIPIQKATAIDTSDASIEALKQIALADKPQAVFLITPVTMSRDKAVAVCDNFLNQ